MKYNRFLLLGVFIITLIALSQAPAVVRSQDPEDDDHEAELDAETLKLIDDVRGDTAKYRDFADAETDGYTIFQDCFKDEEIGGMGQHYVRPDLLDDADLDPIQPEALVYQPREDGSLILVAMEYLVFEDMWTADEPPMLYGQAFHLNPNIPDTPPAWVLHIWLWTHNPEGMFVDYNPTVFCPEDAE